MDFDLNAGRISTGGPASSLPDAPKNAGKYVLFATPSLSHTVSIDFFRSYLETSDLLSRSGIAHACLQTGGCQFIARARNQLATEFLDDHPNATDLFFIDDDLGWTPEAVVRMCQSDKDIVAGVYPPKDDNGAFPMELDFADDKLHVEEGLFRALHVPGGFMRIKRNVLASMAAKSRVYTLATPLGKVRQYDIFQTGVLEDGEWWGEDYQFCQRWRAMGGTIWIDAEIIFRHAGRKVWSATFGDKMREFIELMHRQMSDAH